MMQNYGYKAQIERTLSCPTLCNPMDCNPPRSSVHGESPGKNTGVGCHALLQGIFPTQGLNPGLPHCRQVLYHLSHQGSPTKNYTKVFDCRELVSLIPHCQGSTIFVTAALCFQVLKSVSVGDLPEKKNQLKNYTNTYIYMHIDIKQACVCIQGVGGEEEGSPWESLKSTWQSIRTCSLELSDMS